MEPRIKFFEQSGPLAKILMELGGATAKALGNRVLQGLVHIRASQLNGCAFCVDMHVKEAKIYGERDLRVHHIATWRDSPLFTEKERAALEWTDAVTKLTNSEVSDEVYERTRKHFSEKELSDLTFAIAEINLWNRLNVALKSVPGTYDKMLGLDKAGLE